MALTFTQVRQDLNFGSVSAPAWTITLDDSYPTGGYAISAEDVGLKNLDGIVITNTIASCGQARMYALEWDAVNQRLQAWDTTTGAEVAAGTDLSAYSAFGFCIGN